MEIHVSDDLADLGRYAASFVLAQIRQRPDSVIGLATGSSPLPLYRAWAEGVKAEGLDVSRVRGFALDEYAGIPADHPESYHSVIAQEVTTPVGLTPNLVRVPAPSATAEDAAEYDRAIVEAGGIDLQILGIGRNGHLGFNEPGSPFDSRTRRVQLMPETIRDNARFFSGAEAVPTEAITQGLGTIMEARTLVVVATGEAKADAVAEALTGEISERSPASVLRQHHQVIWCLDRAAASLLPEAALG